MGNQDRQQTDAEKQQQKKAKPTDVRSVDEAWGLEVACLMRELPGSRSVCLVGSAKGHVAENTVRRGEETEPHAIFSLSRSFLSSGPPGLETAKTLRALEESIFTTPGSPADAPVQMLQISESGFCPDSTPSRLQCILETWAIRLKVKPSTKAL